MAECWKYVVLVLKSTIKRENARCYCTNFNSGIGCAFVSQKHVEKSYFQIAEVHSFLMSGKLYIGLKAGEMVCGLHNLYSYFLIFKYITRAQGLAFHSLQEAPGLH